jgi:hypothetical protein
MSNRDLCKGCLTYAQIEGVRCSLNPVYAERRCPCIDCLIKGVCMETCEKTENFAYLQQRKER